jgi:integrase
MLDALKAILDEAVEDEYLTVNPARSKRMRVRVPKPPRTFLEIDELVALEDAAARQDPQLSEQVRQVASQRPDSTAGRVAAGVIAGKRPSQIARELNLTKQTISFHLARLDVPIANDYLGRRAIVTTLGGSGVRVSELCDIRIGHLRLHDPDGARFRIPDAKTEAGIREVQMSPDLAVEFPRFDGHLKACVSKPRKDVSVDAENETCLPRGVPSRGRADGARWPHGQRCRRVARGVAAVAA